MWVGEHPNLHPSNNSHEIWLWVDGLKCRILIVHVVCTVSWSCCFWNHQYMCNPCYALRSECILVESLKSCLMFLVCPLVISLWNHLWMSQFANCLVMVRTENRSKLGSSSAPRNEYLTFKEMLKCGTTSNQVRFTSVSLNTSRLLKMCSDLNVHHWKGPLSISKHWVMDWEKIKHIRNRME